MKNQYLVDQTKRLIRIPSTADNPKALREAVEFVANIVKQCPNVTIERFEHNGKPSFLAYRGTVRPEKFDVILNGHVDVVPAPMQQFEPVEKDGKLFGRGALDMKGTVIVLTDVFCSMVNVVPYHLGLQIVCDEETGGYDGVRHQIDSGVCATFVVVGEYANHRNTIYNAARGLCWAEIAFKGKSAHGGHLWHGTNAVVKASEFAAALLQQYPTPHEETWATTVNIANLSTPNETFNRVPDTAVLKVDFRFTQEDPVFANRESLESFIAKIDPDAKLINISVFEPAVNVSELNPYVQGLSAALGRVTHADVRYLKRPAGSDGRHYAAVNTDVIEFGLYGQHSHGDGEYAELSSFEEYHAAMTAFVKRPTLGHLSQTTKEKPDYVWYANYGSGLSYENFMLCINGGTPDGAAFGYAGCTDKTPPSENYFMSLPHRLYFSDTSRVWPGGGLGTLDTRPSKHDATVARIFLITREQFEQIAAQENFEPMPKAMPYADAMKHGHAHIDYSGHLYDELLYCGLRGEYPIFALTGNRLSKPETPPSVGYMQCVIKGLSENWGGERHHSQKSERTMSGPIVAQ